MNYRDRASAVVAVFVAALIGMASAFAAPSLAATILVVPGTGTPDPSVVTNFMANAVNYYAKGNAPSCPVERQRHRCEGWHGQRPLLHCRATLYQAPAVSSCGSHLCQLAWRPLAAGRIHPSETVL